MFIPDAAANNKKMMINDELIFFYYINVIFPHLIYSTCDQVFKTFLLDVF